MLLAKLANKNHHFLKCYVRHMYMFRDPDPKRTVQYIIKGLILRSDCIFMQKIYIFMQKIYHVANTISPQGGEGDRRPLGISQVMPQADCIRHKPLCRSHARGRGGTWYQPSPDVCVEK